MVEVYYIEDDENIAQAVKEYLYEKNCIVSVFATITDAKKAITNHLPAIVLVYAGWPRRYAVQLDTIQVAGTAGYLFDCPGRFQ